MSEKKRKKLAIIDGKSIFYRGYYAMPNLSTKDGTPTGGVYGFSAMSLELIKRLKPDYVCVAWDKPKTNIRKRLKIFPDYKAGRKPPPEDFYQQIPILQELLEAFSWPLYELDDYEADDIMCGLAKKASKQGIETMLITSDLDALQCLDPLTSVYAIKKGLTNIDKFDPASFEERYGIRVDQFLDSKALKGDSSDNIPGVPGVGEKTAAALLKEFDTLDGIYDNIALIKFTTAKKLEAGKKSAYMSKKVARLYDDAPIALDLNAMDINKLDVGKLANILRRLEFSTLLRNLPDGMKDNSEHHLDTPANQTVYFEDFKKPKIVIIDKKSDIKKIKLIGDVILYTRSKGKQGKDPTFIILSDKKHCFVLDLRKFKMDIDISTILPGKVTGYNLKESFHVLLELGCNKLPDVSHDCLVGAFILDSLRRDLLLETLAKSDLGFECSLSNLDDDELLAKSAEITTVIRALSNLQNKRMNNSKGLIKVAKQVDWPVIPVLTRIERSGMKLNVLFFNNLSEQLEDMISDIEQTIYGYADKEFNIASPPQLSEVLFEDLMLSTTGIKKGKSGYYSTASKTLKKLVDAHPIVKNIEKFREFSKLKSTYVDPLPAMVDKNDRVHGTLNLTIVQTGRLSSVNPNLQNIPVRTEIGRKIREGFIAEKGNVLVSADYSQFELRIAAAMSGDQQMIESFNQNRDIHTETAALIQNVSATEVTKEMRYAAKAVNFGILYGQGVHGLSEGSGMSYADAKFFIDKYFEVRPKLKDMIEGFKEDAKTKGFVETIIGRRRLTPDVGSSNFMVREAALRAAINMPIQGSAADLTKMAMSKLQQQFDSRWGVVDNKWGRPHQIMQVHDSIMVECPEEDAEKVGAMMKKVMENIKPDLGVKLKIDVTIGKNWSEL